MIKHMKKTIVSVAVVAVVGIVGGVAYAKSSFQRVASVKTSQIKLTQDQAVEKFNQQFADKQLNEIELEPTRGGYVYSIDGFDENTDYTVKINANTGKVVGYESDPKDAEDKMEADYALNTDGIISRSEAGKIAKSQANSGKAREWVLDQKTNELTTWEVKVIDGTLETEVTINAQSGEVITVDIDDEAYDD